MTNDDKQMLKDTIENEGFDYGFKNYSHFEEVEDEQFHKLRKEYLAARQLLSDYIGLDD